MGKKNGSDESSIMVLQGEAPIVTPQQKNQAQTLRFMQATVTSAPNEFKPDFDSMSKEKTSNLKTPKKLIPHLKHH
ncbi:hypothetical protein TVAG_067700 [Trichomonas vaginalis G3]|uniref:Uncharacterized protein n=1 Tax=Trichomonas vaginalis (strain ATCC PRA-98 / G3) TaxID=412133 RepID=A2G292_TRIV3|nr:hypothetical protein TVAGG3_0428970 [Trichomonas vaginalis G3]EAX88727.1 hypothetical protein TVAG_067700 [Trichomonas vaginalis G3]KAI5536624.1 hypothetical protein TVAGG3_0428970 [Trichomonas vaginalis G3]|eukprot:XP_001301657.1 hypothetical protein [Trichomonas vaginalis G3]